MKITEKDVGRKVILRNGAIATIEYFTKEGIYGSDFPYLIREDSNRSFDWYTLNGRIMLLEETNWDAVSFKQENTKKAKKKATKKNKPKLRAKNKKILKK